MSATGFGANEIVDLYFDADTVARVAANGAGAVGATNASVPFGALPGAHWFTASGERTGTGASARFVVRTDWRQAGSDSGHAGFNPFESQLSQFSVRDLDEAWAATTGGLCTTTPETPGPAIAGGVLYIGSHCQPRLYAKDAATGANRWQVNLGGHVNGTPAVAGGLVIVAVDSGWVRAYSVTSHALVWRIRTANASMPAITVAGDRVYVLEPGKLSAFSTTCATGGATCQRIWTAAVPFATLPQSAPAANARHVVVAGSGKVLGVAADCNTGGGACSPEWNANLPGPSGISADPVLAGGFAYVADDTSGVSAFRIGCSLLPHLARLDRRRGRGPDGRRSRRRLRADDRRHALRVRLDGLRRRSELSRGLDREDPTRPVRGGGGG